MSRAPLSTRLLVLWLTLLLAAGPVLQAEASAIAYSSSQASPPPTPAQIATCPDDYEPNDSLDTAILITPGTLASFICTGLDNDYFKFKVVAGERIYLHLDLLPANYALSLYDPNGKLLAYSNRPATFPETIIYIAKQDGYYFARVSPGEFGAYNPDKPYRLTLDITIPTPTPTPTATSTPTPTPTPTATPTFTPTVPPLALPGQVYMNKVRYKIGESLFVTVELSGTLPASLPSTLEVWVSAPKNKDAEPVRLYPTQNRRVYASPKGLPLVQGSGTSKNGRLEVRPGDLILALYWWTGETQDATGDIAFISGGKPAGRFSYRIDPNILYGPTTAPGRGPGEKERPVAALMVPGYPPLRFGEDMLIFRPRNAREREAFLARRKGTIVQTRERDGTHVVRVDPTTQDLEDFVYLAELVGLEGELIFSSQNAARLFNLMLEERLDGLRLTINPQIMLFGKPVSDEGGNLTPAQEWWDTTWWVNHPRIQLNKMWMLAAFLGLSPVNVAIVDGGFRQGPDVPPLVAGWDFADNDDDPWGSNPLMCSGTVSCPWHGSLVWGVAGGILNNGADVAGTGGQVARPMFYRVGYSVWVFDMNDVLERAVNDGAAVINISGGFPCRLGTIPICNPEERLALCAKVAALLLLTAGLIPIPPEIILGLNILGLPLSVYCFTAFDPYKVIEEGVQYALNHNVPVVAAAGNQVSIDHLGDFGPYDVSEVQVVPCVVDGVICVGEMNSQGENLNNYGQRVTIWAPSGLPASGDPSQTVSGTSISTPYITGIVALMKAIAPDLTPAQITNILRDTAWSSPADQRVHHAISAYASLETVAQQYMPTQTQNVFALCPSLGWDETLITENENWQNATYISLGNGEHERPLEEVTDAAVHEYNDLVDWFQFPLEDDVPGRYYQVQPTITSSHSIQVSLQWRSGQGVPQRFEADQYVWPGTGYLNVRGNGACYNLGGTVHAYIMEPDPYDEPANRGALRVTNNDTLETAQPLTQWRPINTLTSDLWELNSPLLTFHTETDVDYFWVKKPEGARPPFTNVCEFGPKEQFVFWLEEDDPDSLAWWEGIFDRSGNPILQIEGYRVNPVRVVVQGTNLAEEGIMFGFRGDTMLVEADGYTFRVQYLSPQPEEVRQACEMEHDLEKIIEADLARGGTLWWLFPTLVFEEPFSYPLTCDPRVCDPAQGLAADYLVFHWHASGRLYLEVEVPVGAPLRVQVLDITGRVLGEARPQGTPRVGQQGTRNTVLVLELPEVTPGYYLVRVSEGKLGTRYILRLRGDVRTLHLPVLGRRSQP